MPKKVIVTKKTKPKVIVTKKPKKDDGTTDPKKIKRVPLKPGKKAKHMLTYK